MIAGVVEHAADIDDYRRAVPGSRVTVCRLTASAATRAARLRAREVGAGLDWHLRRTEELEAILDAARLEDFAVENDARPVRDVAVEVLARADWLSPT